MNLFENKKKLEKNKKIKKTFTRIKLLCIAYFWHFILIQFIIIIEYNINLDTKFIDEYHIQKSVLNLKLKNILN